MDYKKGDTVQHVIFGAGLVLETFTDSVKVKFEKLETCRSIRPDFQGMKKGGRKC